MRSEILCSIGFDGSRYAGREASCAVASDRQSSKLQKMAPGFIVESPISKKEEPPYDRVGMERMFFLLHPTVYG
jgi:hypothetical protein